MTEVFIHDSELPSELCFDLDCEDHHPRCSWDNGACSNLGEHRAGGMPWCGTHLLALISQIDELDVIAKGSIR